MSEVPTRSRETPPWGAQGYAGFRDSRWRRVPETEMLGHRLGELRAWLEAREMGVIERYSLRAH